jgi:prophage DNA circulation protein
MPRRIAFFLIPLLLAGFVPHLWAQDQRDVLTPDEVQQIRDSNVYPNVRIKLFLKFVQERVDALKQLTADASADHRMTQITNKLQEFTSLCDEMQDNMDTYDSNHADIRKSLKAVVEASAKWPAVLRALPKEENSDFAVDTAVDSAKAAYQDAQQLATEQEIFFKAHPKMRHKNGSGPD